MGYNLLSCERDQSYLMPPSMRDWLSEGHLAWFIVDAVGQMDLRVFYAVYRSDGWGAAAYDPGMMVAILLYGYCLGVRSSRRIARALEEDVGFRVVAANRQPDFRTICRFRAEHEEASSPSEDYLAVLAGQRQWIATTNFAGCPSRPPDSFANSAVLTTSAKFLMRWAGPSARAFLCRLTPKRNSLSRLWPVQISDHSPFTFSSPRSRNCRNPLPCLIWPNTASTVCIRKA